MILGGFSNLLGACPGCGCIVPRSREWNDRQLRDVFACGRCGPYRYGSALEFPYATVAVDEPRGLIDLTGHEGGPAGA